MVQPGIVQFEIIVDGESVEAFLSANAILGIWQNCKGGIKRPNTAALLVGGERIVIRMDTEEVLKHLLDAGWHGGGSADFLRDAGAVATVASEEGAEDAGGDVDDL